MEFSNIKEEVKRVNFESTRTDCDNFFEAVVVKDELAKLSERLSKFLGEPAWPSKNRLSYQMQEAVKAFGGIMPGQTLYFKSEGSGSDAIFAMLWPWQDGLRTTVKIIQKQE
ncbi:MAG: hypothetical protein COT38_03945 [Candidatus Omnitrophica bacterium CG08_land_8_20_14_0_20_41_16]|uniref:Uncharacterized protein n=1 Tax=Candidatus Sherwoodlollariibacterium unditelluris TaxID=1974757 RepID=A0A2G9YJH2_9BACT|nr:MAG: hypothetical protein COX41_03140 [Candidatus Omnitrophica bacterium CG23_combo_of_CG06-09_8_20_14_all_41_10]PIS33701.1 MAG: hypothetical protein COT38_03945 [Candidatus Omnitrophica bacterium CG08_land_8_20_14_0_20_41_16]